MNYHIELNTHGKTFKMFGTLEELKNKVNELGGKELSIFDSRKVSNTKQIRFTANGSNVKGVAKRAI